MKKHALPVIEYIQSIEPTDELVAENKRRFGQFMLQWRKKMRWTQYTANKYSEALGFSTISYGNLSVIERGKSGELRYDAFYQIARLNYSLNCEEYRKSKKASQFLKGVTPVSFVDKNGQPWGPVEFFALFHGHMDFPWDLDKEEKIIQQMEAEAKAKDLPKSEQEAFMFLDPKLFRIDDSESAIVFTSSKDLTQRQTKAIDYLTGCGWKFLRR